MTTNTNSVLIHDGIVLSMDGTRTVHDPGSVLVVDGVVAAIGPPAEVARHPAAIGAMTSLGFVGQARGWDVPSYVLAMLPYIVTLVLILVPAGLAGFSSRLRASAAPASLAVPYFREDR